MQKSFVEHPAGAAFSKEQIEYAAADAEVAARLYPLQIQVATREGVLQHLVTSAQYTEFGRIRHTSTLLASQVANLENATKRIENQSRY